MFHQIGKNLIPLKRGFGDPIFASLKMAINGGRGDACTIRSLGQGKARWTLFTDTDASRTPPNFDALPHWDQGDDRDLETREPTSLCGEEFVASYGNW